MLDLGPHASFIIAAYGAAAIAVGALLFATIEDDRRQRRKLAELERQGITRRSAAKPATHTVKTVAKAEMPKAGARRKPAKSRPRKSPS